MSDREDSDSDAPEEFTALQLALHRVYNKTRRFAKFKKKVKLGSEPQHNSNPASGFLPDDVMKMLAAREKQVFLPYSEGEEEKAKTKPAASKKRKSKKSGLEAVILSELGRPQCLQGALEFLKKRKMSVQRSSSALNNSNRAFRFLSKSGVILQK